MTTTYCLCHQRKSSCNTMEASSRSSTDSWLQQVIADQDSDIDVICSQDQDCSMTLAGQAQPWLSEWVNAFMQCLQTLFGRPFVKRFALCYRTVVLSVLSVTLVYCGQTVGRIKMKLGIQVGLGLSHTVRWEPSSQPRKKGAQFFGPYMLWPNGWMD